MTNNPKSGRSTPLKPQPKADHYRAKRACSSISTYFLVGFILLVLLPTLLLTGYILTTSERSLKRNVVTTVSILADHKARELDSYMQERIYDAVLISKSQLVRNTLTAPPNEHEQIDKLEYFIEFFMQKPGYRDLLLIDKVGLVTFSVSGKVQPHTSLLSERFQETELAKGFSYSKRLLTPYLTAFGPCPLADGGLAAFLITPVIEEGQLLGAVALQLDLLLLDPVLNSHTSLGASGEIVMAQRDSHDAVLYTASLQRLSQTADHHRVPLTKLTPPLQQALAGNTGHGLTYDQMGHVVVAAWRYIPALRWGMAVKVDTAEAFAPAFQLRLLTGAALGIILLLTAVMGFVFGRSLVLSIRRLTAATDAIAAGHYKHRAQPSGPLEFQQFAKAFNKMAKQLTHAQAVLESRVEARTRELREANAQLGVEIEERRRAEAQLQHLAHHDALTNLPNRYALQEQLKQALAISQREARRLAVLFLDLDRFKAVNDLHGHQVGDQLLIEVADRLRGSLRASDIAARLGGDEFVVVVTQLTDPREVRPVAEKIESALSAPFEIMGLTLFCPPSIGISLYPDDAQSAEELVRHADMAMYATKANRRCT
ncbi:sensor domain-containing diguanylate cyclase [Halorhodospira abdelmalekii]|uniref:sensor domain-containing diguanylate cyclase n=1 Tax=Halorhodospira abdelmalekii TaxID=421629 RepID=UPI001907D189|nr:sensor domain-containing diguanylate cyclase [Halorhodospira abdelmalekii]